MTDDSVNRKLFGSAQLLEFARVSGDRNPMHLDALAARRTQAGAPVVHGIFVLAWCLDVLSARGLPPVSAIKVRFTRMVYVGETAEIVVTSQTETGARVEIRTDGLVAMQFQLSLGAPKPRPAPDITLFAEPWQQPDRAIELDWDDMARQRGCAGFAAEPALAAAAFPHLAASWGAHRTASLLGMTYIVGMVCPGLHSIFAGLSLTVYEPAEAPVNAVAYRVDRTDVRFRMVRLEVDSAGLGGMLECFARLPPIAQASMSDLAALVSPQEFSGSTALVVGGSRGVGETTAKLLAAGGARVILTYVAGRADAERVVREITEAGGAARLVQYDVRQPPASQLDGVAADCLYYCATPQIFRKKAGLFVKERFDDMLHYYVTAFHDLFQHMRAAHPAGISAFYPSSIAVAERPEDMTEYAMAKAAGEELCKDIVRFQKPSAIVVSRLPRMNTDQTSSITHVEVPTTEAVMLPIIREVQANRKA